MVSDALPRTPADDAARSRFSAQLGPLAVVPAWEANRALFSPEPTTPIVPHVWRWADLRPRLADALRLVDPADAERRVLILRNPGLPESAVAAASHTLRANFQILGPGEVARAHRHSPSAFRFVIEGEGAYTTVDGERTEMHPGDFILTPNGVWHDHGHTGSDPVIWLDGLDIPLVVFLRQIFFKPFAAEMQPPRAVADDNAWQTWGAGMQPPKPLVSPPHSPIINYRWERARAAVEAAAARGIATPFDGTILEYRNPQTGGPALPTIGAALQQLPPKTTTAAHQHTSVTIYCVAQGHGQTEIDGTWYEWGPHDVFVVPTWAVHRHRNRDTAPALLFSETDAPVLQALGLYRERAAE